MSDGCEREMTLKEWVGKLPEPHLAHKEYIELQAQLTTATEMIERLKGQMKEAAKLLEESATPFDQACMMLRTNEDLGTELAENQQGEE